MEPGDPTYTSPTDDQRLQPKPVLPPEPRLRVLPLVLERSDLDLDRDDDSDGDYDDDDDSADDDDDDDDDDDRDADDEERHGRGRVSSKRSRRLQRADHNIARAFNRVARAAEHGTSTYIDSRSKSEDRRKDGALVDIYENVARGVSKAIAEASPALVDVAQAYNTRESRRLMRNVLRRLPRLPIIG